MFRKLGLFVVVMVLGVGVGKAEEKMTLRNFDAFELDTTTAEGAWVETVHFFLFETLEEEDRIEFYLFLGRLVYGKEKVEAGILIPYAIGGVSAEVSDEGVIEEDKNVGNMNLYGKVVPIETDLFKAGLGLEFELPSGDVGSDDVGLAPFFVISENLGSVEITQHLGYQFFPGNSEENAEALGYGGGIRTAPVENVALRMEFVGLTLFAEEEAGKNITAVTFEPGVDFRLPMERIDFFIRPSGLVGLTDNAPDWGAGGSLAVNF
jgi:hypothetical protein